jgi:tetratricopeptide (TPR) repeat protein
MRVVALSVLACMVEGFVPTSIGSSRSRSKCSAASFGNSHSFGDKPKEQSAAAMFNECGLIYENARDYKAAADSYRKAIAEEPWNPISHGNLANTLSEMGIKWYTTCLGEYRTAVMLSLGRTECLSGVDECLIPSDAELALNHELASEYLVNLALFLLHVPADISRRYPEVPKSEQRRAEAFVALEHAMKLVPENESIKYIHAISMEQHGSGNDPSYTGSADSLSWSSTFDADAPDSGHQFFHY